MKKIIEELAERKLSQEGYSELLSFAYFMLKKYQWPKTLIGENHKSNRAWHKDEIIEFVHQFAVFLYESKKLKYFYKVSDKYINYYFTQIMVSYVSKKIKENQNKTGLSYESVKRISIEILKEKYFSKKIDQKRYWWLNSSFDIKNMTAQEIEDKIKYFSNIPLSDTTKHYKPLVNNAIYTIFSLLDSPLEESIIFSAVYNLFDQSQFKENYVSENDSSSTLDINHERINHALDKIVHNAEQKDFPFVYDYLFAEAKVTINALAEKYKMNRSTIHSKINKFKELIRKHYLPKNEEEGIEFFKILEKKLDKIK